MTSNGSHQAKPLRAGDPQELGEYRIVGRLGRGGMGTVYLAKDSRDRSVALKLIHPDLSDDDAFRRRFAREVQSAQSVARFSTAAVLDAQLDGETLYIVSEYVAGPNLAEAIAADGPMYSGTLESLAMGIAAALAAIHGAGVIHRDLKPANVLLSSVGPKVIDFGIARALDDDNAVTRSSQLMGTPAYLAPELILGQSISPASDIFSWGCLVAFAGTGNAPFDAPTVPAVLHQISTAEPNLGDFDDTLRSVVSAALSKEPERRPTAQQILDQLVGKENTSEADVGQTMMRSWTPPSIGATQVAQAAGTGPAAQDGPVGPAADPRDPITPTADLQHQPTAALPSTDTPGSQQGEWHLAASPPIPPSGPQPTHAPPPGYGGPSGPQPPYGPGQGPPPGYGPPSGPQQPYGAPGGGGGSRKRTWLMAGGGALALVLVITVAVVVLVRNGDPEPPEGLLVYNDDFASTGTGWDGEFEPGNDRSYGGYYEGMYALRADPDSERTGTAVPYDDGDELQEQLAIEASAEVSTAPDQGQFGVYCFRDGDEDAAYEFLLRSDGAQAQIRRLAGEGGEAPLATSDSIPGYNGEEGAVNTIQATCEEVDDGEAIRLRLWVNDEFVLEETDTNPPDLGEMIGLVVRRPGAGSGPDTVVFFHGFALYQLPADEDE